MPFFALVLHAAVYAANPSGDVAETLLIRTQ